MAIDSEDDEDYADGDLRIGFSPYRTFTITESGPVEGTFVQYYSTTAEHMKWKHSMMSALRGRLSYIAEYPGARFQLTEVMEKVAEGEYEDLDLFHIFDQGVIVDSTGKPLDPALFDLDRYRARNRAIAEGLEAWRQNKLYKGKYTRGSNLRHLA